MFKDKALFAEPVSLEIEKIAFKGYGYYSPHREQEERERFYQKLRATVQYLEEFDLKAYMKPKEVFERHAG